MRKLFMLVTMLLVPTLASAWTMAVKVTNTTAGINAGNGTTLTVGTGTPVLWPVGTKYLYPTNNPLQAVTVKVANSDKAAVYLTGGTLPAPVVSGTDATYTIPANATRTIQTMNIVYETPATAAKRNITLTQTPNGLTSLSIGSSITTTGYTAVPVGTLVTVKAQPNIGSTLSGITVNGAPLVGSTFTVTTAAPNTVVATYAKTPVISAILSLPTSGQIGTPVTASVAVSGVDAPTYAWMINGAAAASTTSTCPVNPVAGANIVQVTVSKAGSASVTKAATIQGIDVLAAANYTCTSCHSGSTPEVVADYNASNHKATCTGCHTSEAHTAVLSLDNGPQVSNTCASCHAGVRTAFRATYHWNNHLEYGPEFTDPVTGINGVLNANESYTTLEDGNPVTCFKRCHFKPNLGEDPTVSDTSTFGLRPGKDECVACHEPHNVTATYQTTCMTCHQGSKHGKVPSEFWNSKHWDNHLETGPEFANQIGTVLDKSTARTGGTVTQTGTIIPDTLNANDSYKTTENGSLVTCAYRCHFRPGMYPADVTPPPAYVADKHATTYVSYVDTLNSKTYTRPGGDACMACHNSHDLEASYQSTCLTCHTGSKHGKVPNEFFASKHWKNNFEYGPEFANQIDTTVEGGNVKQGSIIDGVLDANDSYTTTENGKTVTCAYRCHFRPGMGPQKDVPGYLANGKSTTYVMYSSPYGAGKFYRPGGDSCMACHDAHGLEATARSTCYTCHAGGNHGWSVKAFEKSTHFTGTHAIAEGIGGPTGEACTACHNAHSLEASFATMSTATILDSSAVATGCQQCHAPGPYGIFNTDKTGKAPHFLTTANSWDVGNTAAYTATGATCADCHSHNNSINAGWAESGHGDITAVPWKGDSGHKDWGAQGTDGVNYQTSSNSTNCIRCHSAVGFQKFVDSGFTDISKLPPSEKAGVLTCVACHSNVDKGTVRLVNFTSQHNGKGYTAQYGYKNALAGNTLINTAIALGDMKNSNICMPCHSQRASGQEIKNVFAAGAFKQYSIGSAIYPHEAQPAAITVGKGAYEFTPFTPINGGHDKIGVANYMNTGSTQGPCVGCHMNTTGATHSLEISFANSCVKCHTAGFGQADLDNAKAAFVTTVDVLGQLLVSKGITLDGVNPLPERKGFDMSLGAGATAAERNAIAQRNQGAWFNWYLFKIADPGAYAHNPSYARKAVADSIDALDNGVIDGTTQAAINAMATPINTYTVYPEYGDAQPPRTGSGNPAAGGWGNSYFQGPASGKSNFYIILSSWGTPSIFGNDVKVADLKSLSYNTWNNGPPENSWTVTIYTQPLPGDPADWWYHSRFHNNSVEHSAYGGWNFYATDAAAAPMTFKEFNHEDVYVGPVMTLDALKAAYGQQTVRAIGMQTMNSGYDGWMDGLTITLKDGRGVKVDFAEHGDPAVPVSNYPAIVDSASAGTAKDTLANVSHPAIANNECTKCHAGANSANGDADCISCHSVGLQVAGFVNDNNGVRAITSEFAKWSHHVTGVTLQNAHCAACHLEGKVVNGAIVVDQTKHMVDAKTHLRNADTDADMQWDPAAPNQTMMDNFCMSCHDANGAISPQSAAIRTAMIPAAGKTASATNPFGDTISNRYDKMQRPGVVDVSSQFDTTNNSHHAVKGPRYTGRTRAAGERQIASPATFANNSSALLYGVRQTIYDAGNFNSLYVPLEDAGGEVLPRTGSASLGDDSTLHCGDCHTVGQWKPGSSVDSAGRPTTAAIGAHGSDNEYLLRNSIGTDERHTQNAYQTAAGIVTYTNPDGAFLVCYNCHAYSKYGSIYGATGAQGGHAGEYDQAGRCNGIGNTLPFGGYTTGKATDGTQFEPRLFGVPGVHSPAAPYAGEQPTDFGNIFGIQCNNCHNSGPANGYGGIHGSRINTYTDGMGNQNKMERFLPGLGNTMYVPGTLGGITGGTTAQSSINTRNDAAHQTYSYTTGGVSNDTNWEQKVSAKSADGTANFAGAGCYTLSESTTAAAFEQKGLSVDGGATTPNVYGTWGGCDDHGAAQGTGDHGIVKKIVRPITY